jgi:hypothetical protein
MKGMVFLAPQTTLGNQEVVAMLMVVLEVLVFLAAAVVVNLQ